MMRLLVTGEGVTELNFVKNVLTEHLLRYNVLADTRCVQTSKDKKTGRVYRGGMSGYAKARTDILNWIKTENKPDCRFTTMFDLYALPEDFPAFAAAKQCPDLYQKVEILEEAFRQDIGDHRFLPYIQLHEFEALILADPAKLDWEYLEHEKPINDLIAMVGKQEPERINAGTETAPSKRILRHIPEFDKATAGVAVVKQIGLETLRKKCPHFDAWLQRLETLGSHAP